MSADRLITLAIHTYEKAVALKSILEREGVVAVLNNVNLTQPSLSSGVRVRIYEKDLPLALRIVENPDIFNKDSQLFDFKPTIIVPVDFSDYSYRACIMAFNLAKIHNTKIEIIHSYIHALPIDKFKYNEDISISDLNESIEAKAKENMSLFVDKIVEQIKFGIIPPIKFNTHIVEGVPEDSINHFSKQSHPILIVMGTRGAGKKEKELIGSVTGEVLDTCRYPVFAVPESANIFDIDKLNHILFFCNNEHEDIVALDALYRLLPNAHIDLTIINIPNKITHIVDSFVSSENDLLNYCKDNYPRFNVLLKSINANNLKAEFSKVEENDGIDLIVVPNKKKNVFSRFFNPSLAHKILLHADIPMLTIPI